MNKRSRQEKEPEMHVKAKKDKEPTAVVYGARHVAQRENVMEGRSSVAQSAQDLSGCGS